MDIVRKIDELRIKRGWTFYRLSQETGLSQQTFSKWIEGNTIPTIPALEAVCKAFDITLSNFFAEDNLIEVNNETKELLKNWHHLNKDSIIKIVQNYINRKI